MMQHVCVSSHPHHIVQELLICYALEIDTGRGRLPEQAKKIAEKLKFDEGAVAHP